MSADRPRTELGERLEVRADEARLARNWDRVTARVGGGVRGKRAAAGVAVIALAAAAALALWVARDHGEARPGPLAATAASGGAARSLDAALRSASDGTPVTLDDGSAIRCALGTTLVPLENSGERFSLLLRGGRAHFSVTPGGPRRWTIEAGAVSVEVVGTVFTVERGDDEVRVAVERGHVLVRGDAVPDHVRSLHAGESLRVAIGAPLPHVDAVAVVASHAGEDTPPTSALVTPEPTGPAPPAAPSVHAADGASLLAAADASRRAGRVDEALEQLAAAARLRDDPSAGLASLTRGRLLLEQQRPAEASVDLQHALRDGLPPALVETCRARLVEALASSGDHEGARRAADEYLRAYPHGEWRTRVEQALR